VVGYYVTAACCLFLLVMMPIWSGRSDQATYPIWVIALLAVVVVLVPVFIRRRRREGAAAPGDPGVSIENRE
jgi:hydrogenase-4 membrane subunit HyfE